MCIAKWMFDLTPKIKSSVPKLRKVEERRQGTSEEKREEKRNEINTKDEQWETSGEKGADE